MLRRLRYRGDSAEVGVWRGDFSSDILDKWPSGGAHLLVDPYKHFPCPLGERRDKQCSHNQSYFDSLADATLLRLQSVHQQRAVLWRNFSTDFWVAFKVWATLPITVLFTAVQMPLIMRHSVEERTEK